ncbi:TonB-dependent receptor [Undibacterium seohonense]|uniref:TonB-dependent receptor n=1 Tax=Undibacterium seohonense TaxID=1344950 RepID=A0ABR6X9H4_9BURK|nr:TonB-dependent receptor [Undibacterium seohonense]
MKPSLTPIASAVAVLAMTVAMSAQAQQVDAKKDDTQQITVTGVRASMQQSLNQKRNAESHVEVITAEDIGKMPDKNVADSLQRVSGVTTSSASGNEGGFDENDRVSMRGTNPSLTQTLINGHNMAAGDWFVLNQSGAGVGRSISYTLLPSELVGRIEVNKSSQASLVEGGVAGSINVITRKPLEFKKQLTAEASLGVVYAELPKKTDPQLSGLINWKNDANTFGLMIQAFSEKRSLRRDGQEILGWSQIKADSATAKTNPDLSGAYYPSLMGAALFEQTRHRTGGLVSAQFKPSNEFDVVLSGFSSKLDAANYNRNYMFWGANVINAGNGQTPEAGYTVANNNGVKTLTSATFKPVAGTTYGVYDQISRPDAGSEVNFFSADATWKANADLKFNGQLGTSKAKGKTPTQDVAEWNVGIGSGASYRINGVDNAADWKLGNTNYGSRSKDTLGWVFGYQNTLVNDEESWLKLDGEYQLDAGVFTSLKFGARATEHKRDSGAALGQGPGCKNAAGTQAPWDWSQSSWCPVGTVAQNDPAKFPSTVSQYPSNFGSGLGGNFPSNIWYYTPAQLAEFNKYSNRDNNGTRLDYGTQFALKENVNAFYVQGNMEGEGWSGNVGMRFVQTKESVISTKTGPGPGQKTSDFGTFHFEKSDNTYNDVLPSLNLRFDVQKDLVARVAVSKTMTRPDFGALASAISLSPPASATVPGSGSGANPNLKPIRSNNFDASLEWYFAPRALLSGSVYYMNLTSYVGIGQETQNHLTESAVIKEAKMYPYVMSVPINTSAKVKGFELGYEQPIGANFGVAANYTFADAKDAKDQEVVGASKNTYNLSGYYEDDTFNARLSYSYRSAFYSGLDRETAFSQDATGTVSASLGYKINENFALSFDAHNLNKPTLKYFALNENQPRSIYQSGRQYYLTLRAKM